MGRGNFLGVKDLPFLEHRTLADPLGAVFLGQFLIKMPLEDGDPTSFHVFLRGGVEKGTSGKLPPRDSPRRSRKPYSVPFAKVFEEERGRFGGGKGKLSPESFPFPPPISHSPPSFSECSFLKMVLRLTLKTSATFWTEPCTLRALRRMPRSMSAMMSLRGRS